MAKLPKIDSPGLRLAKQVGAERVSSVVRVSKIAPEADTIIARCAKIAKQECERFINAYSAAMIADAITARADEIKAESK